MGWRADGGLWLLVRGGGLYLSKGSGVCANILYFHMEFDYFLVSCNHNTSLSNPTLELLLDL